MLWEWVRGRSQRTLVVGAVAAALGLATVGAVAVRALSGSGQFPVSSGQLGGSGKPNIVFVLVDDMSVNLLPYLPHVRDLADHGLTFDQYVVSDSLCCPSRASILTGRFPHSTGIFTNNNPDGGFGAFHRRGEESSTVATDLQARGYRTAMMGKYLNQYEPDRLATGEEKFVPPGWNDWAVAGQGYGEFNYTLNESGTLVRYGGAPKDYLTDVLAGKAASFIKRSANDGEPFFLEVATFAPHAPYIPAPRHENDFPGLAVPQTPAYDALVTDPPPYLADRRKLTVRERTQMDGVFRKRAQDMKSVDEMIGRLEQQIIDSGVADDTYLVFSSDNGFHLGEHRLTGGKQTAFETDIRVPLVIGGPGIAPGRRTRVLAQNVDLRSTFTALAGTVPGQEVDGRDLLPAPPGDGLAGAPADGVRWRAAALVEHHGPQVGVDDPDFQSRTSGNPPTYNALRLHGSTFVEYEDGTLEYYDLAVDPDQLVNRAASLPPARVNALKSLLKALTDCSGQSCRAAAADAAAADAAAGP